jgi:hypothetical protein
MEDAKSWTVGDFTFTDLITQPYNNCVFAAGVVDGHPVDDVYIRWERNDGTGGMLMLRQDEMAAIAHLATGVLWSSLVKK